MFPMQPCRFPPGEVPNCTNLPPATGVTIYKGQVVTAVLEDDERRVELHDLVAATGILGVSQGGPALDGTVNVAKADHVTEFLAHVTDALGELVEVTPALVGTQLGIVEVPIAAGTGSLETYATLIDAGIELVQVTDIKPELNIAIFKFLPTTFQETAEAGGGA